MLNPRNLQRVLAVLAALALHLVVLALLSGAAHAKGEQLRRIELQDRAHAAHERSGSSRTQLIDLTPPEVRSLGSAGGGEDAFDLPEPLGTAFTFVVRLIDEPEPVRMGCDGPLDLDRGRAPPRDVDYAAA
jgi:hypothetical protein